ncbi:MAG: alpha-amylase MalA [Salinirussus sp.]
MHHPGPPRFVSVGDAVDLAPRDPDPAATYRWTVERAPPDSTVTLDDAPVQELRPDVAGTYVLSLSAPDGRHHLTVRCLPGPAVSEARPTGRSGPRPRHRDSPGTGQGAEPADAEHADAYPGGEGAAGDGDSHGQGSRPRIRLDGRIEDGTVVVEADPRPAPGASERAADLDVEFVLDDRDGLDGGEATVDGRQLRIPGTVPDRARIHAVAVGDAGHSVPDAVAVRRDETGDLAVDRLHDPPAWATDAVYYEVYVRTFAPDAPDGARLDAIADRLDDLAALGVDVVWLTPVLEHDGAPHGYNVTDFFSIASDLGDRADYRRLIERAHDLGMRVLFDLVLNHSARDHPHFQDAYGDPDSEYREWYEWQSSGEPGTYFDWEYIANFDFGSLEVRRHLLDVVDAWAPLVDGFRCDMAWAVPESFWREVRDRVKARDPEFLLLDETIPYVPDFHALFDVHFDSTTYAALRAVGADAASAPAVLDAVDRRRATGFPDHAGFLLYAENHDETRYVVDCGRPAALAAAGALCTLPGAPLVYAGQELGQLGRRDDLVRAVTDEALTAHYRRLLALRRSMPALAAGADCRRVGYEVDEGDPDRVVAYGRVNPNAAGDPAPTVPALRDRFAAEPAGATAAVVVCNFGDAAATVSVDPTVLPVDAATGETVGRSASVRVDDVVVLPAVPGDIE